MVCVLISFLSVFTRKKNRLGGRVSIRFTVAAPRVPSREDVLQRYYENSVSLLEKIEMKYLDLQYLDIFHPNATYVKGLQDK